MTTSRWFATGVAVIAVITALTIALWPESKEDKARADGKAFGTAVAELQQATTTSDVNDALDDLANAAHDTVSHVGESLSDQVTAQNDALYRAVDGYLGTISSDHDSWDQEVYHDELDQAVSDVKDNASNFRTDAPKVHQAFWDGVEEGLAS
jgi:gas vesicle protein